MTLLEAHNLLYERRDDLRTLLLAEVFQLCDLRICLLLKPLQIAPRIIHSLRQIRCAKFAVNERWRSSCSWH